MLGFLLGFIFNQIVSGKKGLCHRRFKYTIEDQLHSDQGTREKVVERSSNK